MMDSLAGDILEFLRESVKGIVTREIIEIWGNNIGIGWKDLRKLCKNMVFLIMFMLIINV